jgi:hypothetical protein
MEGHAILHMAGHSHGMEKFAPRNGVTTIVEGAGGRALHAFDPRPHSAWFDNFHFDLCRLALHNDGTLIIDWPDQRGTVLHIPTFKRRPRPDLDTPMSPQQQIGDGDQAASETGWAVGVERASKATDGRAAGKEAGTTPWSLDVVLPVQLRLRGATARPQGGGAILCRGLLYAVRGFLRADTVRCICYCDSADSLAPLASEARSRKMLPEPADQGSRRRRRAWTARPRSTTSAIRHTSATSNTNSVSPLPPSGLTPSTFSIQSTVPLRHLVNRPRRLAGAAARRGGHPAVASDRGSRPLGTACPPAARTRCGRHAA